MSEDEKALTRSEALKIARGQKVITGEDWVVFYDQRAGTHWVKKREPVRTVEVMIIELCPCGWCKPYDVCCQRANVANGIAPAATPTVAPESAPTVVRDRNGDIVTILNAFTPSFDASKLDDLDRHEAIARAATPGPWHRGHWFTTEDNASVLELDTRTAYEENERDLRVAASLHPDAKRDAQYGRSTIIDGCGCCNSPRGRDVDAEHIVANAPDVALQLNARAKLLARLLDLSERWLIGLLNADGVNPWRLALTSKSDATQRIYVSADFERLINHAWAGAPEGVC